MPLYTEFSYSYENKRIETPTGSFVTIRLDNGNTIHLSENSKILLDDTVTDRVDAYDAIVHEVNMLQNLIESGEDLEDAEIETAIGVADEAFEYDVDYYGGDETRGRGRRLTRAYRLLRRNNRQRVAPGFYLLKTAHSLVGTE